MYTPSSLCSIRKYTTEIILQAKLDVMTKLDAPCGQQINRLRAKGWCLPRPTQKIISLQPIKLHFTSCVCAVRLLKCMLKFDCILHCHKIMVSGKKMHFPSNNTLLRWFYTEYSKTMITIITNWFYLTTSVVSPFASFNLVKQGSWTGHQAFIRWRLSQALSLRACVPGPVNLSKSLLKGSEFFTLAGTYSEGNNIWKDDII